MSQRSVVAIACAGAILTPGLSRGEFLRRLAAANARTLSQDGDVRPTLVCFGLCLGLPLIAIPLGAQAATDTTRSVQASAVRVFFDCPNFHRGGDFHFMRTEIGLVNCAPNPEDS